MIAKVRMPKTQAAVLRRFLDTGMHTPFVGRDVKGVQSFGGKFGTMFQIK